MTDSTQRLIRELFDGASMLPEAERRAWIEARAQGNIEVVSSVLRLLHNSVASGKGFLAEPAIKRPKPPMREGTPVGPFRVLKEIATGGMGIVYLAIRTDGFHEGLVAVKVVRPEIMSEAVKKKFLAECAILGKLNHRSIALLFDCGTMPSGLPYSIMEYVDGKPLDVYCRETRASMQQRLDLFRQTCEAVQYLHEHNVLHLDLKPGNILVTHNGHVKLLDFGISKVTGNPNTTTTGLPIMTAVYASPEQITTDNTEKLKGTSDIYSLGVVLYELLTGVRPLTFDGLGLPQVLDTVKTKDPLKPSTQKPLPVEADPDRLFFSMRQQLAGDLDCILLMALRKEPERRYATAADFAADIERFQKGQPVLARGDGKAYLVSKSLRRNRLRIAALLLIGISMAGAGAAYYEHQRDIGAENRAASAEDRATTAEEKLQKALQQIDALNERGQKNRSNLKAKPPEGEPVAVTITHARNGLIDYANDYRAEVPAILEADPSTHPKVQQLAQDSLAYFSDVQSVVGNDPATIAALGKAYQAVAKSQWSPAGTPSLNDSDEALRTYTAAIKSLQATDALKKNPQIKAVVNEIMKDPATQQFRQALEAAAAAKH